jgi:hypothetical protein
VATHNKKQYIIAYMYMMSDSYHYPSAQKATQHYQPPSSRFTTYNKTTSFRAIHEKCKERRIACLLVVACRVVRLVAAWRVG